MDSSSSSNAFSIIMSIIALLISILGYLDNRRNLRINETNLNIILKGESNKKSLERCLHILRQTSNDLKKLPEYSFIVGFDEAVSDIIEYLHEERKALNLSIRFNYLSTVVHNDSKSSNLKIDIHSIRDSKDFRTKTFHYKVEDSKITYSPSFSIDFTARPKIITNEFFDFGDLFDGLADIENDLKNLKNIEPLISTFDPDFFEVIDNNCQNIFDLLYEAIDKEMYSFDFHYDMKRSEIEDILSASINYNPIKREVEYISKELKDRSEELGKTLGKQILNSY